MRKVKTGSWVATETPVEGTLIKSEAGYPYVLDDQLLDQDGDKWMVRPKLVKELEHGEVFRTEGSVQEFIFDGLYGEYVITKHPKSGLYLWSGRVITLDTETTQKIYGLPELDILAHKVTLGAEEILIKRGIPWDVYYILNTQTLLDNRGRTWEPVVTKVEIKDLAIGSMFKLQDRGCVFELLACGVEDKGWAVIKGDRQVFFQRITPNTIVEKVP